jgi:hypothetical protein
VNEVRFAHAGVRAPAYGTSRRSLLGGYLVVLAAALALPWLAPLNALDLK